MFLDFSNLSAITIALPTIEKEFGVNLGDLQWVVSAYALTVARPSQPSSHQLINRSLAHSCCWVGVAVIFLGTEILHHYTHEIKY